jgi:hypothetical protein
MMRRGKSRISARPELAYFVRRSRDGCAVIKLYEGDREEVVARGLELTDAENLCEQKIDEMRGAVPRLRMIQVQAASPASAKRGSSLSNSSP